MSSPIVVRALEAATEGPLLLVILVLVAATCFLLGVAWERIETDFYRRKANLWFARGIAHDGELEPPANYPRPVSCRVGAESAS